MPTQIVETVRQSDPVGVIVPQWHSRVLSHRYPVLLLRRGPQSQLVRRSSCQGIDLSLIQRLPLPHVLRRRLLHELVQGGDSGAGAVERIILVRTLGVVVAVRGEAPTTVVIKSRCGRACFRRQRQSVPPFGLELFERQGGPFLHPTGQRFSLLVDWTFQPSTALARLWKQFRTSACTTS
jgi:hypothetical protein